MAGAAGDRPRLGKPVGGPSILEHVQRPAVAVLPIIKFPDKTLRQRARKVRVINRSIIRLANDMIETMDDADGVGLAANQVGVLRRVIVVRLPEDEVAQVYVNPEIVRREGERLVEEGCLSVPGYVGTVTRSIWVRFRGLDLNSKLVRMRADSLLAQVLEHEVDHLNGILYMDHLAAHETLRPVEEATEDAEPAGELVHPGSGALRVSRGVAQEVLAAD